MVAPSATETTYEVMTDHTGHPAAAIEADSDSDIMILSKDEQIARLQVAAPASDFAIEHRAKIFATPMVDSLSVCRESAGKDMSDGRVRFTYQNFNTSTEEVLIPISGISPAYYLSPLTPTDDLLLNDIRTSLDEPVVPEGQHRSNTAGTKYQAFQPRQGSFTVHYDLRNGPLTWNFIGKSIVVDTTVAACETQRQPECARVPNTNLRAIYREYLKTVRNTLKDGARNLKRGTGKDFNTTPYATKILKTLVKLITSLKGVNVCDPGAVVPQSCTLRDFPHARLLQLHEGLFKKAKLTNPRAFEKVRLKHYQQFSNYLALTFPKKVYFCASK